MQNVSLLSSCRVTCEYPLLMSTEQNHVSSLCNLFRMCEDPSKGVPTLLVLLFTSLRSVTSLALMVLYFVCFCMKKALEQVEVGW